MVAICMGQGHEAMNSQKSDSHSREKSIELLRSTVGYMVRQKASFDPTSYALWYEHAAGTNPSLSEVLAARLRDKHPLTDPEVAELYSEYLAPRDESLDRLRQGLTAVLRGAQADIEESGEYAVRFDLSLKDQQKRLEDPAALENLPSILAELLGETERMCSANQMLRRQVESRVQEVRELTQRLERAETEALRDPLTGLLNRRGFERLFAELLDKGAMLSTCSVLVADINEFKQINDANGHPTGDQVLKCVARILRAQIKGTGVAARFGGDEFAVLLPHTPLTGAQALADQIQRALPRFDCAESVARSICAGSRSRSGLPL